MSGNFKVGFFSSDLKEEKIENAAGEEFQVAEYQGGPLRGSTFPLNTSSNSNWNPCLKAEENPDAESMPIYAASLLEPSFIEYQGTLNRVKAEENSSYVFHGSSFPEEERRSSSETPETSLKEFSSSGKQQEERLRVDCSGSIFQCSHCLKHFEFPFQLRHHIQVVHNDERPFKDEQCSVDFKVSCNLRERLST